MIMFMNIVSDAQVTFPCLLRVHLSHSSSVFVLSCPLKTIYNNDNSLSLFLWRIHQILPV